MLRLRRGVVAGTDPLTVEVAGEARRAWADPALVGEAREGDEVLVNVAGLDLGLGSGGFDLVHANLTRGLDAPAVPGRHVIKLNYTSLQHPVEPLERVEEDLDAPDAAHPAVTRAGGPRPPVCILPLHGHLAPAAWAAAETAGGLAIGYVQGPGGALPGRLSRDVAALRERGLLAGHITAGPAYGGEHEAISLPGAIDAAAERLGWDAILLGPGPGILGSATRLGHGGIAALEGAHAALALGCPTLLAPRLSGGDPRPRHRGLSHHTATVLELLLAPVRVPVPEVEAELWPTPADHSQPGPEEGLLDALRVACGEHHDLVVQPVDLEGYESSGLPTTTMGRGIAEDRLFFAAALAAGGALARVASRASRQRED